MSLFPFCIDPTMSRHYKLVMPIIDNQHSEILIHCQVNPFHYALNKGSLMLHLSFGFCTQCHVIVYPYHHATSCILPLVGLTGINTLIPVGLPLLTPTPVFQGIYLELKKYPGGNKHHWQLVSHRSGLFIIGSCFDDP